MNGHLSLITIHILLKYKYNVNVNQSVIDYLIYIYSTNNECIYTSANAYLLYACNPWAYNHINTSKDF